MPSLSLSLCVSRNPRTAPLLSGQVSPEGVQWAASAVHPSEMFWRQLKFADFDVSEMSLSSLTIAASRGVRDWIALPIFTTRSFFHTRIVVRDGAGIETPADLAGKTVGVAEYQQTAAVWSRGALQHDFGVRPEQMTWWMERPPARSHGGTTGFQPPPGVKLSYIQPDVTMEQMLAAGDLDAAIVYIADRNLVDRSRKEAREVPGLRPLFSDPMAEAARYHAATGIFPINHCVVIRASLLEKHPWLALNIYSAFLAAKKAATEPLVAGVETWEQVGLVSRGTVRAIANADPMPYGVTANQKVFEALSTYLYEQGLVPAKFPVEDLFAPSTQSL
jgi:4,5-dihydroxyphthalate decarboxylase